MLFDEVITGRRSARRFRIDNVSDDVVDGLLRMAVNAPSSMNGQPWEFLVVRDRRKLTELAAIKDRYCPPSKKKFPATMFETAPLAIVICVDEAASNERGLENAVFATSYLMLAAYERGLSTVYLSAQYQKDPGLCKDIRQLFNIPDHISPVSILPLGYPDETPPQKTVKSPRVIFEEYHVEVS